MSTSVLSMDRGRLMSVGAPSSAAPRVSARPQWTSTAILTIASASSGDEEQPTIKSKTPEACSTNVVINNDAAGRVAHLEHSVRFLQEQHRLMLSGLHAEIEALRERNRDLQFQLIFNKESLSKNNTPTNDETANDNEKSEESRLKLEISRAEREATAARGEARAAEARALQIQRLLDAQTEKIRELESQTCSNCGSAPGGGGGGGDGDGGSTEDGEGGSSRAELRARLADAERLVRRLRADADRQRRELQCMKNSLQASIRASSLEAGYGFHNSYHFPPVPHTPEFWREPIRDDFSLMGPRGRNNRRPLNLPELSATGHQIQRSTVYANNHTRQRPNGYENKKKVSQVNCQQSNAKSPEEVPSWQNWKLLERIYTNSDSIKTPVSPSNYPEMKVVVTKILPNLNVGTGPGCDVRTRPRRHHHRRPAATDT